MPLGYPPSGFNLVNEFQVSAIPWLTSSTIPAGNKATIEFDRITSFLTVRNDASGTLRLAFTDRGLTTHYVQLNASESLGANWRVKTLFLSGAVGAQFTIAAGVTEIPARFVPALTGSMSGSNMTRDGIG